MPDVRFTDLPAVGPAGETGGVQLPSELPPGREQQVTQTQDGIAPPVNFLPAGGTPAPVEPSSATDPGGKPDTTVIFSHPQIQEKLIISTGMNDIFWSYTLNTVTIPTYGGEVIQILSVAIDDLVLRGQVLGYGDVTMHDQVFAGMETIYRWFLTYAQMATQGALGPVDYQNYETGDTGVAYNQTPVTMQYPLRGWQFQIIPKGLPGFKYGTEAVAPEWALEAAVVQPDLKFLDLFDESHLFNQERLGNFESFNPPFTGWATAGIGYDPNNPFSAPYQDARFNAEKTRAVLNKTRDYFNQLIPKYLEADYSTLSADYSKPASLDVTGNLADKIVNTVSASSFDPKTFTTILKGGNKRK